MNKDTSIKLFILTSATTIETEISKRKNNVTQI